MTGIETTDSPVKRTARPLDSFLPRLAAFVLAAALAICSTTAFAQNGDLVAEQRQVVESASGKVETLAGQIESKADDDAALADIQTKLKDLSDELANAKAALQPRLSEVDTRLEQLGEPPGENEPPEPPAVTHDRRDLLAEKAQINSLIGEADGLSVRIERMISHIGEMRRSLFARTLSKRYEINFALMGEVVSEFGAEMRELYAIFSSWIRYTVRVQAQAAAFSAFVALLLAAVLAIGGHRLLGGMLYPDPAEETPSYLSRLSVAFWSTLLPSVALAASLGTIYFLFQAYGIFTDDIGRIVWTLFRVIVAFYFITRLARAALSPHLPNWRLIPIETGAARMLVWLVMLTAAIKSIDFVLGTINTVLGVPLSLTVGNSLIATVLIGILVILIARIRPFPPIEEGADPRPWPTWLRYLLYVLGAITMGAALLGYIGLARFLAQQIVVTGAILAMMYMGFLSSGALSRENAFAQTSFGRGVARRFLLGEGALDQLGLVSSIAINILVVLCGVPLILMQWGFQWNDIVGWFLGFASEIRIGSFSFSVLGILTGLLVFFVGYFVTRWFQSWVDGSVLARGRVDTGVRNSIRTSIGYAGVALAALIGIAAAGIDLSNLALVAGALSLGIGFGLQNIVSNFVSGLILLAERPFKAGDWIEAGGVSGTVKRISVRATEIETFQRQTVILPNSELINAAVGNWTHKNSLGRVEIAVGVAYGSDVQRVYEILLEIARNHPLVLKNPEPFVLFTNFGESSLDFEVRVYLADILMQLDVMNDIRFAVVEAFEKEGIQIPFPQRDIHFVSGAPPQPTAGSPGTKTGKRKRPATSPDAE